MFRYDLGLPICLIAAVAVPGCFDDPNTNATTSASETGDGDGDPGDGDGDPPAGDGDGDPNTGDGDGDPNTGDGDGDPATGDGDGDPTTGDGDGDPEPELVVYDLYAMACAAEWISAEDPLGAVILECDGVDEGEGAVIKFEEILLENEIPGDRVLFVAPWNSATGATSGGYENIDLSATVQPVLRTQIGCRDLAQSCNIQWQVLAREQDAMLWSVVEDGFQAYDGSVAQLELDLSELQGGLVEVALAVLANGEASSDDGAMFIYPRIVDLGPP